MPRDYNINISVGGGNSRGSFGGGNVAKTKSTLNSRNISNGGEESTSSNLARVFTIGLAFNLKQKHNELMSAYTNNRLQKRKRDRNMLFTKYAVGIAVNPYVGITYAVGDMAYRGIQFGIGIQKQNREAQYYRRLSGNSSFSGSRYRGEYS